MKSERMGTSLASFKPIIGLLAIHVGYAGMNIIVRVALDEGMNHFVFVAYKEAVATMAIAPFAYFLERNKRPLLTWPIFCQIFVLATCGITINQNFYYGGLRNTSATFASAISNITPVFVFLMATASGMEKVDMKSKYGQAKVVGTVVCVAGAMIMIFYRGPSVLTAANGLRLNTWMLGAIFLFVGCLFWSGWVTFQAPVVRKYPAELSLTAIMVFQGTVLSFLVALVFDPKASGWRLKWDTQLLSILYSPQGLAQIIKCAHTLPGSANIMSWNQLLATYHTIGSCSSFAFFVQIYCIREKGPVFVAMFHPISTLLVAVLENVILRIKFHLGSLLGAILIIAGLYIALWGKAKDDNLDRDGSSNSDIKGSLLQDDGSHQSWVV